jgi:transcriptional regulator of acetoin/glycerol metabolism
VVLPFFATPTDRIALARKRYFEEGILPTGVVSDAVFQSWMRCYRSSQLPSDTVEFQPVSVSRSHLALQKNRELLEAWLGELPEIGNALGAANCSAILTDASGVLIGVSPTHPTEQSIIPVAHRVGVNLSEACVGTTAPGIVARTGKAACVLGAEHYYDSVSSMFCTAAPIRDVHGKLAGILDFSSETKPFHFDPVAVVGFYAASIENRLLVRQSRGHLIVKFQFTPAIIDSPMVGMVGFDESGRLLWLNSVASGLLGIAISPDDRPVYNIEAVFHATYAQFASLNGRGCVPWRLSGGLQVHLKCELHKARAPVVASVPPLEKAPDLRGVASAPLAGRQPGTIPSGADFHHGDYLPPNSLKEADADLIRKYLGECKGNISCVARKLKVSRGLIYRRLQELCIDAESYKKK